MKSEPPPSIFGYIERVSCPQAASWLILFWDLMGRFQTSVLTRKLFSGCSIMARAMEAFMNDSLQERFVYLVRLYLKMRAWSYNSVLWWLIAYSNFFFSFENNWASFDCGRRSLYCTSSHVMLLLRFAKIRELCWRNNFAMEVALGIKPSYIFRRRKKELNHGRVEKILKGLVPFDYELNDTCIFS